MIQRGLQGFIVKNIADMSTETNALSYFVEVGLLRK